MAVCEKLLQLIVDLENEEVDLENEEVDGGQSAKVTTVECSPLPIPSLLLPDIKFGSVYFSQP